VSITVDPETVIVTVKPPLAEEKVEAPVEVSAVKVEGEEEKAERARLAEAEAPAKRAAEKAKGGETTPPKEEAPKKA